MKNIAVLLTCFNRKQKTDECLHSFQMAVGSLLDDNFDLYIVDDNSTDGTESLIKEKYPSSHFIQGNGSLFWAGGMRLAWKTALQTNKKYNGFLLINDDVRFLPTFWEQINNTIEYVKEKSSKQGVYVVSTIDEKTKQISYGGHILRKKVFKHSLVQVLPSDKPQECHMANANILYVSHEVVDKLGILDIHFTHSLADFDYSLTARENGFPVLVCPNIGGFCTNDHPENLLGSTIPIQKRIKNLYSIKGLALNEYLYYLRKHFWWKALYAFIVLWLRTLLPQYIRK